MNTWPFSQPNGQQQQSPRPMPGVGMRLSLSSNGYTFTSVPARDNRDHPFRPALAGARSVTIRYGLVEGKPPTINGKPLVLSGVSPTLALEPGVAKEGVSWVCLEVVPDDDGTLGEDSQRELKHTAERRSLDPKLGRVEIAQILWRGDVPFRVLAIQEFNLRYQRVIPGAGGGAVRHLFF